MRGEKACFLNCSIKRKRMIDMKKYLVLAAALAMLFTGCSAQSVPETRPRSEVGVASGETAEQSDKIPTELNNMTVYDLDGNEVVLGEMIAPNKVTMLNIWATFCGPCLNEMPDLAELEQQYKDKGFEIVGLTGDVVDSSGNFEQSIIADTHSIIEETGVKYPVLIATNELMEAVGLTVFPTTFFVDSEGALIAEPVYGSMSKQEWEEMITKVLAEAE